MLNLTKHWHERSFVKYTYLAMLKFLNTVGWTADVFKNLGPFCVKRRVYLLPRAAVEFISGPARFQIWWEKDFLDSKM
jgi:hypothetical protein